MLTACTQVNQEQINDEEIAGIVNVLPPAREPITGASVIECEFQTYTQVEPAQKEDESTEVSYKIFTEKNPLHIKFIIDDEEREAKMVGNYGETDLIISRNDSNGIVLLERSEFGSVFAYNIYPNSGIGIWTKTNEIFGSIYSFISVGSCW